MDADAILRERAARLGGNLSVSYSKPLHIVRGRGCFLYDVDGRAYLDCVNNVCHVGHCHGRVVKAASEQLAVLNTNTRYLHEDIVAYAKELTATLPEPLSVVFMCCTGSEANELALRLARTYTGGSDVVVLDTAYHGNTSGLVEMSPYKFKARGGFDKRPHVHVASVPDPYRNPNEEVRAAALRRIRAESGSGSSGADTGADGRLDPRLFDRAWCADVATDDVAVGEAYARDVERCVEDARRRCGARACGDESGGCGVGGGGGGSGAPTAKRGSTRHYDHGSGAASGLAAMFVESVLGCAGQVVLPQGYMRSAFRQVRAAGGVCVCDEVQVGFGRAGSHMWAFQTQGADVVPDIVTTGKPIGNGFPMSAVVTTPAIAAAFNNGMEYFNTFGGSPVAARVGRAVLGVIRDERLQENARRAGAVLLNGLRDLGKTHPSVGHARGMGLFVGLELVKNRVTLEPAPQLASAVVERLRDEGMLLSTDGPLHNVLKLKPPLVFSEIDARRVVSGVDAALRDLELPHLESKIASKL